MQKTQTYFEGLPKRTVKNDVSNDEVMVEGRGDGAEVLGKRVRVHLAQMTSKFRCLVKLKNKPSTIY